MRRIGRCVLVACTLVWLAATAQVRFPAGPITLVIPVAPGDAADIAARALAEDLSRILKTPVLSINRPGAGGAVGTRSVVQAKKDGQTILFAQNSALTFRAVLDPAAATYDALSDLAPLGTASRTPSLLAVRGDAPYKSLAELVAYARSRPGQVHIGHPGVGSVGDFCIQSINALTGAQLVAIPYAGASPAIVALRGEHIEGVVLSLGALSAHLKSGAFRGLVASSRFPDSVDIPTMRELGYQEDLFGIWFSFHAPAGIPADAKMALIAAIEQAVNAPALGARLASVGILQSYATPEQTTAEIRAESRRVGEMAKKTGVLR